MGRRLRERASGVATRRAIYCERHQRQEEAFSIQTTAGAEMNKAGLGARQLLLSKHPRFGYEKARLVCVLHTHLNGSLETARARAGNAM